MGRYVTYHNDGSVRMDWYTFQTLPLKQFDRFVRKSGNKPVKVKSHGKVKEFA